MTAVDKTRNLLRLNECPLTLLVKNEQNPNKMKPREFDLLCDNMGETGWTDPALARPFDLPALEKLRKKHGKDQDALVKEMLEQNVMLSIVGGHHRFDAASFLGFETGPVTVIMDPAFDEEREKFQIVRMNIIHGKLDPAAFVKMYEGLAENYSDDALQELFGFADEAEFKKIINSMAKQLPDKATQDKFKEAAKEIKTIDGLAKLLNHMFTTYGDTIPYGYMIFDYGGQNSMWLRIEGKTWKALQVIGDICVDNKRTVDDIVGSVLQLIAKPESKDFVDGLIAETKEVKLSGASNAMPTKDHLDKLAAV